MLAFASLYHKRWQVGYLEMSAHFFRSVHFHGLFFGDYPIKLICIHSGWSPIWNILPSHTSLRKHSGWSTVVMNSSWLWLGYNINPHSETLLQAIQLRIVHQGGSAMPDSTHLSWERFLYLFSSCMLTCSNPKLLVCPCMCVYFPSLIIIVLRSRERSLSIMSHTKHGRDDRTSGVWCTKTKVNLYMRPMAM